MSRSYQTGVSFTLCGVLLVAAGMARAELTRTIPNDLGLSWPWELTHFDFDPAQAPELGVVEIQGNTRPVQIERTSEPGRPVARAWFIATIGKQPNADGKGNAVPTRVPATFRPGQGETDLSLKREGDAWLIANKAYEFRLRAFDKPFEAPRPLDRVPHWCGGMRARGEADWDGRAWFRGTAPVRAVRTEIVQQGPVFIDARIVYEFADPGADGETEAPLLRLGKQCHKWEPNVIPTERLPRRQRHYELLLRFTAGDPWIEVVERYHLPADPAETLYGGHHYFMHWGRPTAAVAAATPDWPAAGHMPVDTVTWVRWFLYDKFGGNTEQNWVPAVPREDQKGRPFVQLRPRWNQGGGGGQDFALTSGGAPVKGQPAPAGDKPAVALFATFASKWAGPYRGTIMANAEDGNRGFARFPLTDGEGGGGNDGESQGGYYGQRSYALWVGRRAEIGHLNGIVRRHTDWTLVAQMNKYILDWPRDPSKAGPGILISRELFERIKRDVAANRRTPETEAVLDRRVEYEAMKKEAEALKAKPRDDKEAQARLKELNGKLDSPDTRLLQALLGEPVKPPALPSPNLWIERRYQDDFLGPTSGALRRFPGSIATADLLCGGQPIGGMWQAALGYIMTDLDHWPGWHNAWSPGNPNFHTDKYMPGVMIGAAMRDHPHSAEWLAFGRSNLDDDLRRVLWPPDGVGQECPGYSGYSFGLQLETARLYRNIGAGNPIAANALTRGTGRWHRHLLTPFDRRIGRRHEAPHGDTHRWDSGMGRHGFTMLGEFWAEADPAFASEMIGTLALLPPAKGGESGLRGELVGAEARAIPAMPADKMDWASRSYYGFGAIMRTGFGTPRETFLSFKAGPARGHDHNTELAYHYYAGATPISLDYNCSYHPRGDHAAIHNSMTFGRTGVVKHNTTGKEMESMEELSATAHVGAFVSAPVADVVVAERRDNSLTLRPWAPTDEFHRGYPTRTVEPGIVHRRLLTLVKHAPGSKLEDYLVVRDETRSPQAQQVNIHLLSRDLDIAGPLVRARGQWDKDMVLFFAEADELKIEPRSWYYFDEWMLGPGADYDLREGESTAQWEARMAELKRAKGWKSLPGPDWKPRYKGDGAAEDFHHWEELIAKTGGRALMPPPGWETTFSYGEYQQWVRAHTKPGTPVTWVLCPFTHGTTAPTIEAIPGGVRVTLGAESEEILIGTEGGVSVKRAGQTVTLLQPGELPALGDIKAGPEAAIVRRAP